MKRRYPIGTFVKPSTFTQEDKHSYINEIKSLPERLTKAVESLEERALEKAYRDGGWTVRQVVHHVADSHMNSFIRFKLALTEENPTIRPYDEGKWAELSDYKADVHESLLLLQALHRRWVTLIERMTEEDYGRTFRHPETEETLTLYEALALYAWHGNHHLAHVNVVREK
ncbi:YfiT family bacillithiol transferase [Priestia endophytica]